MNKYHTGERKKGKGPSPATKGGGKSAAMNMKPGFPSAALPGKTQTRARDKAGTKHCSPYADSKGL